MRQPDDDSLTPAKRQLGVPLWGAGLGLPAFVLLAVARHYGYVSRQVPLLVILGQLVFTLAVMAAFTHVFPPGSPRARPRLHLFLQMALIGTIIYSLGWGAILAVGFLFPASNIMNLDGSRNGPWAMAWIVLVTAAGELAVGLGWAHSLVGEPLGHGLALLAVSGCCAVVWMMTYNQRAKEEAEQTAAETGERFRALVQNALDMILVVGSDGLISYASPSFETSLGYPPEESVGLEASGLLSEDDVDKVRESGTDSGVEGIPHHAEVRIRHRDGNWRWCDVTLTNLAHVHGIEGWVVNLRDISERKMAAEALRQAHEQFRSAFENAPIGMGMVDLSATIVQTNPAFDKIVGRPSDELVGVNLFELTHAEDRQPTRDAVRRFVADGAQSYEAEMRYVHRSGRDVWVSLRASCVRDDEGAPLYLIVQVEDISERRELRERLAHAAVHDPLTGLPNRVLFSDRLETALRRSRRDGRVVSVMFLDLDHFKLVNDSLGHEAGDQLLCHVARKLEGVLRTGDTLARFGGDEFTVLCEVGNRDDAMEIAGRLVAAMHEPISLEGGDQYFSISVGVAFSETGDEHGIELLRNADAAMYTAKDRGPGHLNVHEADAEESNVYRLRTSNELHEALERGEFELHYQPIVELHGETLVGLEALVRWRHPTRGLLLPDEFIGVAESSGLILPLGRWVIDEACRQGASWHRLRAEAGQEPGRVNVSVNVSARQLSDPAFLDVVVASLEHNGLDPDQLWFEITESMVMRQGAPPVALLQSLRELGVHFEVDDFGTGYSSLSYLKQLPVETLKIDRAFVAEIDTNPDDTAIVRSIIALGEALGLSVVAEGVERNSQADALRALGCFLAQGFLYGRALPADQLGPFPSIDLAAWRAPVGSPT